MFSELTQLAIDESVEPPKPADMGFGGYNAMFYHQQPDILPTWGNPAREFALNRFWYDQHNTLTVGANVNIIRRVKQVSWELEGGRNLVKKYQEILQESNLGAGWDDFLTQLLQAFLSQDSGGVIEIIGKGDADTELPRAGIAGIRALDPLNCYFTSNPEYPVFYRDSNGALHQMHATRVIRMIDLPSVSPFMRGLGLSALSRAIAIANMQILMSKYHNEKLSDLPPTGIVSFSGISSAQLGQALERYQADRTEAGASVFRNLMALTSLKPDTPIKIEFTPFAQTPDNFDYAKFMEWHVKLLALAIGDDPQEIAPLSGAALGTGTQSAILHAKGQAKLFGDILTTIERIMNIAVLPRELKFKFKPRDREQDKAASENARDWGFFLSNGITNGYLSIREARQIAANTIEQVHDVLLDEAGNIRVVDNDIAPDPDVVEDIIAEDTITLGTPPPNPTYEKPIPPGGAAGGLGFAARKDIQAVRSQFENDFEDFLEAVASGRVTSKVRGGTIVRALIAKYGRGAYREGLIQGGVDPLDAADEDRNRIQDMIVEQSPFVRPFLDTLFGGNLSEAQLAEKPRLWFDGSIQPFYYAGLESADKNGLYEWAKRPVESCATCRLLDGQKHRMKDWRRKGFWPGSNKLDCKMACKCSFSRTTGRAAGNFA